MCGIWGYVGADTLPIHTAWEGLSCLTHRGPDDWGLYIDGAGMVTAEAAVPDGTASVLLGNRRLSILDLSSAGTQPMVADGRYWIVYNGEVYNYRELRDDLRARGYSFTSDTDTEVILRAYQADGPACVDRFRGMFAFAVYDRQTGRLFAARDRFGIKPLYYSADGGGLAFASEVMALVDSGVVPATLDPVSVDGYLALGSVPGPRTIIAGVRSLPPGSTLRYDPEEDELRIDAYWAPRFTDDATADRTRLRQLVAESVALRLRADVPVGAFLSGGLDSSTIVAMMRAVGGEDRADLHTFSIGFDRERFSETAVAGVVAEAFDTVHHEETVTAADVRDHMDDIVAAMDQPTVDGVNTYFVSKLAADAGMKVVLSGLGSDELFHGYPTFDQVAAWYPMASRLYALPRTLRRPVAGALDRSGQVLGAATAGKVADAVRSDAPFGASYLTARGLFTSKQRQTLLGVTDTDWPRTVEADLAGVLDDVDVRDAVSAAELGWYMHHQLLRDTDVMAMAHSLEVRVPFLDAELAEYVAGLAPEAKARGEKDLLKEAMADEVPLEVIEREKTGFTFPFADWLREDLGDLVDEALSPKALAATPLDADAAASVRRGYERGDEHWSRVWALVVLSWWVEHHLSGAAEIHSSLEDRIERRQTGDNP
jgi:asparagine synthase (glutamine-hydrolysing)